MDRLQRKKELIHALAVFLSENEAGKSVELQMETGHPRPIPLTSWAVEWGKLRTATGLSGWKTISQMETELTELLLL